jgi:hypothetical protein
MVLRTWKVLMTGGYCSWPRLSPGPPGAGTFPTALPTFNFGRRSSDTNERSNGSRRAEKGWTMPHLTDSELEKISSLFAAGDIGNARKIVRLLRREPMEGVVGRPMKRMLVSLLMSATIALTVVASTTDASAYWRGWGWGPAGVAAGIVGGAVIAGAIIASRPPGYVAYPGYAQPVYGPGCYWASRPVYDPYGRVVGYSGQPVQVCPNYAPPAPPPPGYAGSPPPPAAIPPR